MYRRKKRNNERFAALSDVLYEPKLVSLTLSGYDVVGERARVGENKYANRKVRVGRSSLGKVYRVNCLNRERIYARNENE